MERSSEEKVLLAHGSGGRLSHELVARGFLPALENPLLSRLDDAAVFDVEGRLAFTTDSYIVTPLFFSGGDIGRLAVCGTVNDLAMSGARPLYLSLAFIIEEGLPLADLGRVVDSIKEAAAEAGVSVVTGDTKVVNRGSADRLFVNTSGVGVVPPGVDISGANACPGDRVIVSGPIGDHGIAVMAAREGLTLTTSVESDCAPLNGLVADMLAASRHIHCLRDPTRGGLATTLNEFAAQSGVGILVYEDGIAVRDEVRAACEMLGLDPLYVANEGRLVAIVAPEAAEQVVAAMRGNRYGADAAVIGEVVNEHRGRVVMRTRLGSSRIVDMLAGELLPRIC
ncbi:MAG: hydrogenase expression/formation protein HypE [Chloroflexota bacterium]|nr:hydrogenase expression/formation protein HypE [Chloroflexota bacterium]